MKMPEEAVHEFFIFFLSFSLFLIIESSTFDFLEKQKKKKGKRSEKHKKKGREKQAVSRGRLEIRTAKQRE